MKSIDTSKLSTTECWSVQINGFKHCKSCKWTGISPCEGKNIILTGRNALGFKIGWDGIDTKDRVQETANNAL